MRALKYTWPWKWRKKIHLTYYKSVKRKKVFTLIQQEIFCFETAFSTSSADAEKERQQQQEKKKRTWLIFWLDFPMKCPNRSWISTTRSNSRTLSGTKNLKVTKLLNTLYVYRVSQRLTLTRDGRVSNLFLLPGFRTVRRTLLKYPVEPFELHRRAWHWQYLV